MKVDKKGCSFRNLNSALNFQMKQRTGTEVGIDVKQAKVLLRKLYIKFVGNMVIFLGKDNPKVLGNTLL